MPDGELEGNRNLFTGRSKNYSRYRPGYPDEIVTVLQKFAELSKDSVIADVGSGTGLLARIFLSNGNRVYCVEPNVDMRQQAGKDLSEFSKCTIIDGTAEDSGLPDQSVDFVVSAQAFHWFDPILSRKEFLRILRPGGFVALVWNDRVNENGGFTGEYDRICRKFSPRYHSSGSTVLDEDVKTAFFGGPYMKFVLPNSQKLTLEGLKGRYFSASYAIASDDPKYPDLIREFDDAFARYHESGYVSLQYRTQVYVGKLQK